VAAMMSMILRGFSGYVYQSVQVVEAPLMSVLASHISYTGWWLSHPSEKYDFVSWDYEIPNMEK